MAPIDDNPFCIPSLIPPLPARATGRNFGEEGYGGGKENIDVDHAPASTTRKQGSLLQQHRQESEKTHASPSMSALNKTQPLRFRTPQTVKQSSCNHNKPANKNSFSLSPAMMDARAARRAASTAISKPTRGSSADATPESLSLSSSLAVTNDFSRDRKRRVLLFGETMASLFCLTENSTDEQRQLCRNIVDGPHADDPGRWRRVLELAESQHKKDEVASINLVRLNRRATLRFALDHKSPVQAMTNRNRKEVVDIWLSFARAHVYDGNLEEARRTYQFLEGNLKRLQSGKDDSALAAFYLAFADFEGTHCRDPIQSREIIIRGIKEKSQPTLVLEMALATLRDQEQRHTNCSSDENVAMSFEVPQPSSSLKNVIESRPEDPNEAARKRSPERSSASQKRRKTESGALEPSARGSMYTSPDERNELVAVDDGTNENNNVVTDTSSKTSKSSNHGATSSMKAPQQSPAVVTGTSDSALGKPPAAQRPSLTSRLTRKGLSGKAKRVEAEKSMLWLGDENASESDSEGENSCGAEAKTVKVGKQKGGPAGETKNPAEKSMKNTILKHMDLSYMWAWDPTSREKGQNDTKPRNNQKHKIDDESTSSGQLTSATQGSTSTSHGSKTSRDSVTSIAKEGAGHGTGEEQPVGKSRQQIFGNTAAEEQGSHPNDGNEIRLNGTIEAVMASNDRSFAIREQTLVANANVEFLPLVHEDNILKVNGSSYVKLGVVGKGGSCKVYRALSKKCAVVAIKRVKLDGIDKKAIDGYANEISLLKRLRGNPAIIQMYDSEVDLQRKSIFLVMELGEVDLNHVLQRRALSDTSISLNMNFIRLTWQQMLSAVHCIHEERIIHSDLKPANFLFVRGALKLIDFGIAKAITNEDTTKIYRESHIGTLNYMSPESILDTGSGTNCPRMKIGRASDVWSLGCILYEMVYGKTPFATLHFVQKLQAIISDDYHIDFPEAEESAVDAMKLCLRRAPEERPPIMGKDGLLNEHTFLHSSRRAK